MVLVPWLYWPTTTVHPLLGRVNGQPQYSHLTGDQRPWHARPTHPPSYTGVSNKSQINSKLTICCLSQFKQDTGEPNNYVLYNPIRYLLQTDANANPGPSTVHASTLIIGLQRQTVVCLSNHMSSVLIQVFTSIWFQFKYSI